MQYLSRVVHAPDTTSIPHAYTPLAPATSKDQALPVYQTRQYFGRMLEDASSPSATTTSGWQLRVASSLPSGKDDEEKSDARTRSRKLQTDRFRRAASAKEKAKPKGKGLGRAASSSVDSTTTSCRQSPGLTLQSAQQTQSMGSQSSVNVPGSPQTQRSSSPCGRAGVRYHNEVQAADSARREQLGPPHVHVFGAMITALITQITRITPQPSSLDFLKQVATWLNASRSQQSWKWSRWHACQEHVSRTKHECKFV